MMSSIFWGRRNWFWSWFSWLSLRNPKDFNRLANKVQAKPKGDDHLNGKYDEEKYILGGWEILEYFICLLQKTGTHGWSVKPKGVVSLTALSGKLFSHQTHLQNSSLINVNIITSQSGQSTKKNMKRFRPVPGLLEAVTVQIWLNPVPSWIVMFLTKRTQGFRGTSVRRLCFLTWQTAFDL